MASEADQKQALEYFAEAYRHQMQGELEDAIALYKKSLELFPTAEAHTFLGWTYSFRGDYDEAIAECRRAIELDPDFGNPYNDIGSYLIEKGRVDEAIPWLEKATRAPRYEPRGFPWCNLGRVYEAKHDYAQALAHYRRAVAEQPGYLTAIRAAGRLKAMQN